MKWDGVTSAKTPVLPLVFYMTVDHFHYHFLLRQLHVKVDAALLQKSAVLLGRWGLEIHDRTQPNRTVPRVCYLLFEKRTEMRCTGSVIACRIAYQYWAVSFPPWPSKIP